MPRRGCAESEASGGGYLTHGRWAALSLCELVCEQTGWDEKRLFHDSIGKAWSWLNMAVSRRSHQ